MTLHIDHFSQTLAVHMTLRYEIYIVVMGLFTIESLIIIFCKQKFSLC